MPHNKKKSRSVPEIILTDTDALLTYLFLWAKTLQSSEMIGRLIGQVWEFALLKINDPENLILIYLAVKCLLVVVGHFAGHFLDLNQLFLQFRY